MPGIDFDAGNSRLQIGIEVEYPKRGRGEDRLVHRGHSTSSLQSEINNPPTHIGGRSVYDGTVGLEVVSNTMALEDAPQWYAGVIEWVEEEWGVPYQPVGLMHGGSTAGTHIHLSELSERKAEELAELSKEPWMQILFCSSIANDGDGVTWPVFRGGRYCDLTYSATGGHYAVVNNRGGGHYEWRLPEPMVVPHVEILVKFLRAFEQSTDAAIQYAQERLDDADDRITAIRRAEKVGMDIEEVPTVRRQMAETDPEQFFETVQEGWALPEIYNVEYDDTNYYMFESRLSGPFEVEGIEFTSGSVLYADSLNEVEDAHLRENVVRAYQRQGSEGRRETEATKELKDLIKKKKK